VATSGFAFDPATLHVTFGHIDLAHSQIDVLAIAVILVLTGVLALGIRESTSVNTLLVGIQVIAIGLFIVGLMGAVGSGGHALFVPPFPTGFKGVLTGAGLVFFAYIGFDTVTVASEEARNPKRDVPIAVIASLVIGCLLYMGIAYVTVGLVPWKAIDPNAGMADAVKYGGNARWLVALVFAGAFAGTTTVMLTSLLGQVRIFYVMARDRMLPPVVARINVRTSTPLLTTLTTGAIVAILAGVIPIEALLALVNVGTLSAFVIVCVGVLVLRRRNPEAVRPFRAPLISVTAPLGALMCLGIMVGLGTTTWIRFIVWFVLGVAVYAAYGYRHSRLRGGYFAAGARTPRPAGHRGRGDRAGLRPSDHLRTDGRRRWQRDAASPGDGGARDGLHRGELPAPGRTSAECWFGLLVGSDRVRLGRRRIRGVGTNRRQHLCVRRDGRSGRNVYGRTLLAAVRGVAACRRADRHRLGPGFRPAAAFRFASDGAADQRTTRRRDRDSGGRGDRGVRASHRGTRRGERAVSRLRRVFRRDGDRYLDDRRLGSLGRDGRRGRRRSE
jgi:amino acid transporter